MIAWLWFTGCAVLRPVEGDDPCLEAGYAIAYVTEVCTGDVELANRRFEDWERDHVCIERTFDDPELEARGVALQDLYDCAFAIRQLPCEVVERYGDDFDRYHESSEACDWVVEPKGGA